MDNVMVDRKGETFRNNILEERLREAFKKKEEEERLKERLIIKGRRKNNDNGSIR